MKRIWDIDGPEANKIFLSVQKKHGITDGGVEPFWLLTLSLKVEKEGITENELKQKVEEYYDTIKLKKMSKDMDTWAENEAKKAKRWY